MGHTHICAVACGGVRVLGVGRASAAATASAVELARRRRRAAHRGGSGPEIAVARCACLRHTITNITSATQTQCVCQKLTLYNLKN